MTNENRIPDIHLFKVDEPRYAGERFYLNAHDWTLVHTWIDQYLRSNCALFTSIDVREYGEKYRMSTTFDSLGDDKCVDGTTIRLADGSERPGTMVRVKVTTGDSINGIIKFVHLVNEATRDMESVVVYHVPMCLVLWGGGLTSRLEQEFVLATLVGPGGESSDDE